MRPTFDEIKSELELFKEKLIQSGQMNERLPTIDASDLKQTKQTKERMRSLQYLVSDYMDADKYEWDRFVLPRLEKQIERKEENESPPVGQMSPLSINVSKVNLGGSDEIDECEAHLTLISHDSMRMNSTDSMTIHHHQQTSNTSNASATSVNVSVCERVSIAMPVTQLMTKNSSSMAGGKSVTVSPRNSQQTDAIHKLGASVQMDVSIDLK